MAQSETQPIDFENALQELEKLVEQFEQGDLTLEDSLKQFEHGIKLARACQRALKDAEQKVRVLTEAGGETDLIGDGDGDNDD
ncbi:MAG: exodeoxyribonuclease VII small subunit [Gammaproteobacteria bacterium]